MSARRPEDADTIDADTIGRTPPVLLKPKTTYCPCCDGMNGSHWGGCPLVPQALEMPKPGEHFGSAA